MKWNDFFGMTRRERRGTIALMALIALVLAVTALFRYCSPAPHIEVKPPDIEQFEQQIDSVKPSKPTSNPPVSTRKRHLLPRKEKKTHPGQRRLDPVPQI